MPNSKCSWLPVLLALLGACTSTKAPAPEESGPTMTTREFATGVAMPAFDMLVTLGAYYCKEGVAPESEEVLAASAGKHRWSRSSDLSETPEEVIWKATLASPSSLSESGEIATSWRFAFKKPGADECSLRPTITAESRICLKGEPPGSDPDLWAAALFVDIALRTLSKAAKAPPPVSRAAPQALPTPFCFGPSMIFPVAIDRGGGVDQPQVNEMMKKKLEGLLRR